MEYEIKQLAFDDDGKSLSQLVELQNIVYAERNNYFSVDGFRYLYLDNPMGKVISFNAFNDTELVAHYACIPYKMRIGDRIVNGLLDIATVTHPDHRGKGLFKRLAKTTFEYAKNNGFEFILGVANANSFPGYMKHLNFKFISKLDVKIGWGCKIFDNISKKNSIHWDRESFSWRLKRAKYSKSKSTIVHNTEYSKLANILGLRMIMGGFKKEFINDFEFKKTRDIKLFNLYIGLGADLKRGFYFNLPRFVKYPPFNLIFLDLTNNLPEINKDNIFFQLIDFDVA